MNNNKSGGNRVAFWGFLLFFLIVLESFVFGNGSFTLVILGGIFLYFGIKKHSKWLLIAGILFIMIALLNLFTLRLFVFILFLYILYKLWKGTPAKEIFRPLQSLKTESTNGIWKNKLFSVQSSPFSSYEWEDIHMQGFLGDIQIDVTDTVLPKQTSLISVRQGFGKIKIELPYEIPVRIHYTTLYGKVKLFQTHEKILINESLHMKDGYPSTSNQVELIITLSTWIGDIEVTRK